MHNNLKIKCSEIKNKDIWYLWLHRPVISPSGHLFGLNEMIGWRNGLSAYLPYLRTLCPCTLFT